jgi:hypothetical protein
VRASRRASLAAQDGLDEIEDGFLVVVEAVEGFEVDSEASVCGAALCFMKGEGVGAYGQGDGMIVGMSKRRPSATKFSTTGILLRARAIATLWSVIGIVALGLVVLVVAARRFQSEFFSVEREAFDPNEQAP